MTKAVALIHLPIGERFRAIDVEPFSLQAARFTYPLPIFRLPRLDSLPRLSLPSPLAHCVLTTAHAQLAFSKDRRQFSSERRSRSGGLFGGRSGGRDGGGGSTSGGSAAAGREAELEAVLRAELVRWINTHEEEVPSRNETQRSSTILRRSVRRTETRPENSSESRGNGSKRRVASTAASR